MEAEVNPVDAAPAHVLATALALEPGAVAQSLLLSLDRSALSPDDAVTFVEAAERIAAWWAAITFDALVAASGQDRHVDEFRISDPRDSRERVIRIEDSARAGSRRDQHRARHRHRRISHAPSGMLGGRRA